MKSTLYFLLFTCLLAGPARAQLGMNGTPHPSAALDVKATNKAFYPPRLTTVQRKAIVNPQPGAFVYDLDKGTFYLFDGQNWSSLAINPANNAPPIDRTASDGAANDYFGISVAISGDYALVGAYGDDVGANSNQGSAYVFVRSGSSWTQQAKLTASDGVSGDRLGISVALSGDHASVGAYEDDIGANNDQGSAYLFKRTGTSWSLVRAVTDNSPANTNNGQGVGISNGSFIIGGPGFENGKGKVAFGTVDN